MEERIYELRVEIVRLIKHPAVLQLLVPHIIDQTKAKEIKRLYEISTERANHRLLDLIIQSNAHGKWTAFQDALKESNYPYLATLLQTNAVCFTHQRRILELFAPFLEQEINPNEVIDQLYNEDVIDQCDKEEIAAEQKSRGAIAASMLLLERLQTHLEPDKWFKGFLDALYDNSYKDLVRNIDPDYFEKKQLGSGCSGFHLTTSTDKNEMDHEQCRTETKNTSNRTISENINRFWTVITQMLDLPCVIDGLVPTVVSYDKRNGLLQEFISNRKRAIGQLLDDVITTENGVAFVQVLERTDYPYLGQLLRKQCSNQHNTYCEKVVQIFAPEIQYQINICDIIPHLIEEGVINQRDAEIISSAKRCKGDTAAAIALLDCIQSRLSPEDWYCKFLEILMKTSHGHVVEMVEPDFFKNPHSFTVKITQLGEVATGDRPPLQLDDAVDKEIALLRKKKELYMNSKSKADEQIEMEYMYMKKFLNKKCEELRQMVKKKALEFEARYLGYEKELLLIRRKESTPGNAQTRTETELEALKKQFPQFAEETKIEVKFERNLTLHFLTSVGYVTEVVYTNTKKCDLPVDESFQLKPDTLKSVSDHSSNKSSADQGSSYLQITGLPSLAEDTDGSVTEDDNLQDDVPDNTETDECTIELEVSKRVPALHQLTMKDIAVLPGQQLACICERTLKIIGTENFQIVTNIPLQNKQYNKLALLKPTVLAVISPDTQPVRIVSLIDSNFVEYEWECEFKKCTMVSHKGRLFILCMGAHLHIYRGDEGKQDIYDLGVPANKIWLPKCAVLNENGTELYISDVDSVYCFKYFHEDQGQRFQWDYYNEDSFINRQLFIGLSTLDRNVILLDKNNNSLLSISSQGGFYRGTIKSSAFSDCDLVAFDQEENLIHLISYRYSEYKRVKLDSSLKVGAPNERFDPYVVIV